MSQTPKDNIDSLSSIELINEKRQLLKRVVMITRATERMQDSLKSVLILGQPSTSIPRGMLKYYQILSNKIKQKPTKKIHRYLVKLQELIKSNLQGIINIIVGDHDEIESETTTDHADSVYSDEAMNLLNEFNRQSHTAVSLKILLQRRGVYTSGAVVKECVQQIEQQIERLERREKKQRKRLQTHIREMHADLNSMLKSGQYSDDMKKVFRKVMTDLESDQAAIERGERIDELQLSFEVVATGVDKNKSPVELQQQVACETEEYLEEFDQTEQLNISPTKAGFFRTLFRWLNTPWSVSWRDARKRNGD